MSKENKIKNVFAFKVVVIADPKLVDMPYARGELVDHIAEKLEKLFPRHSVSVSDVTDQTVGWLMQKSSEL